MATNSREDEVRQIAVPLCEEMMNSCLTTLSKWPGAEEDLLKACLADYDAFIADPDTYVASWMDVWLGDDHEHEDWAPSDVFGE